MRYKGYEALIAFDEDDEIFHGEIVNLRDVITFQADAAQGLKAAMAESAEDYLAFCACRDEGPEKPGIGGSKNH